MTGTFDYIGNMAAGLINRTILDDQSETYLSELKTELGIDIGIIDYDDSLRRKIRTAIAQIEQYCSIALQPQMITVNYSGYTPVEPLPFGPVWTDPTVVLTPRSLNSTITFTDMTGSKVSDGMFPCITGRFRSGTATYKSGYSRAEDDEYPVPDGLIGAVLEHAASSWRSGGITGGKSSSYWKTLAGPYRRF